MSQVGTQAFQVLALFWLASHTQHAGAGALFLAMSLLPPVLAGPYITRWSAQFSPRSVMVACDLSAALIALPVAVAMVLEAPTAIVVGLLLTTNALLALTHALMMPTVHATVPALVTEPALPTANGWMQTTQQVATVIGQALGGIAFAIVGPIGLCAVNMAGFALSGILLTRLREPAACVPADAGMPKGAPWSMLRSNAALRQLTILSAVFNVLYAPWLVLMPFHVSKPGLATPDALTLGLVLASYGVGSLMGNLYLTKRLGYLKPRALWWAMVLMALVLLLLGQTDGPVQTSMVLTLMGAGIGVINVQIMTRLQLSVPAETRAGAIAVMRSSVHLATPMGYGAVALAQHSLGLAPATVFSICGALLLGALLTMKGLFR